MLWILKINIPSFTRAYNWKYTSRGHFGHRMFDGAFSHLACKFVLWDQTLKKTSAKAIETDRRISITVVTFSLFFYFSPYIYIYMNFESVFMKQRTWTFCKGILQHVKDRNAPYHPLPFPSPAAFFLWNISFTSYIFSFATNWRWQRHGFWVY